MSLLSQHYIQSFYVDDEIKDRSCTIQSSAEKRFGQSPLYSRDVARHISQYALYDPTKHTLKKMAATGNVPVMKYLVQTGHDWVHDDKEIVKEAIVHGQLEVLQYLRSLGVNIQGDHDDGEYEDMSIFHASRSRQLLVVKYLLTEGMSDDVDRHNLLQVALIGAIAHLDIVQYLVSIGADIHTNDEEAVQEASRGGHLDVVQYLVSVGADIHARDDEGGGALQDASFGGHLDIVQYLVSLGADIHAYEDGALRDACSEGHLNVVQYLVYIGADIHIKDDWPIRFASFGGHVDVVKYLVSVGADIHAKDDEAVRKASSQRHLNVVKYLVSVGADIHAQNDEAVREAIGWGYLEMVKYLVSIGADIYADTESRFRTAKSVFAFTMEEGNIGLLKFLKEKTIHPSSGASGVHVNYEASFEKGVYWVKSRGGLPAMYEFVALCAELGEIHAKLCHLAMCNNKEQREKMDILINQHGANPRVLNDSVFHTMCHRGNLSMVKYLVSRGADVHGHKGRAISLALQAGHVHVAHYLLHYSTPIP